MRVIESSLIAAFQDMERSVVNIIGDWESIEQHSAMIADLISLDPLETAAQEIVEPLSGSFTIGSDVAYAQLDVTDEKLFDLVHTDAVKYAQDRAAEMVGKKYVHGFWINNPDAKWAITESTRDSLRNAVINAYENGLSPAQLAKELKNSYGFSAARAKLIAKTETSRASIQGTLAGWKRSGLVEGKSSILSDDHDIDDECDENEDAGVVSLDADFPSGDDGPPYHPGCNCSLVAELIPEDEEEE